MWEVCIFPYCWDNLRDFLKSSAYFASSLGEVKSRGRRRRKADELPSRWYVVVSDSSNKIFTWYTKPMISGAVKGLRSFIHVFGVLVSSNDILQSTNRIQESKIFFSQLPANIFSKAEPAYVFRQSRLGKNSLQSKGFWIWIVHSATCTSLIISWDVSHLMPGSPLV